MISEFFQPGGTLQAGLDSYEERPEQERMAKAVALALADGSSLIVEAGTGTGKSLAYLVPALQSSQRVIISTGTRSLQDQLLHKDLPVLQSIVGVPFDAVPLKGTSNYLCRRKFAAYLGSAPTPSAEWDALRTWALHTEVGDRAELTTIAEDADLWTQVTTGPESRLGSRCPHYDACFVTKARRRAENADLVVVNHHLFFSDLALRKEHPGARVLPEYDAVVFDEAHGLEEVMTQHFGVELSSPRTERLLRDWRHHLLGTTSKNQNPWMPRRGDQLVMDTANAAQRFFAQVRLRLASDAMKSEGERFTLPDDLMDEALKALWLEFDEALEELYAHGKLGSECLRDDEEEEKAEELRILANRCSRLRDDLAAIADRSPGPGDFVFWGRLQGQGVALAASPVGVEHVISEELLPNVGSLIFTSATLSAGGHFGHIRERLGLGLESAEDLLVDSPFNYQEQCLLYLPRDMPDPRDPESLAERYARIAKLLALTDGHAFVLFTSYRAMQACHRALKRNAEFPFLMQGEAPRQALLETFKATPRSVLFATGSFWEGVDVPGGALSHVLIDKLPFEVPTDPLNEARMARLESTGASSFEHYQLPRAAIAFRQGFGRLIRRKGDRGIVSVLDPRIVTKRYGRFFLDSLPATARTSSMEQVRRWWQQATPTQPPARKAEPHLPSGPA